MLPKRQLGNTDIFLSTLALGTVKFGRNTGVKYPTQFDIPDLKTCANLIDQAHDLGFNILDTAPAYGLSEQRLGDVLKTRNSQDWLVCTKAGENYNSETQESSFDFSPKAIKSSLENSLRLLNKTHIDIFLIHSNGDDLNILQQDEIIQTLHDLKTSGLIRAHGISTKTIAGGLAACELLDVVMVTHNLNYQDEICVINKAEKLNKGVLIKKGLASGHLNTNPNLNINSNINSNINKNLNTNLNTNLNKSLNINKSSNINTNKAKNPDPVSSGIKFVLETQGVTSLVLGSINPSHLVQNVLAASSLS